MRNAARVGRRKKARGRGRGRGRNPLPHSTSPAQAMGGGSLGAKTFHKWFTVSAEDLSTCSRHQSISLHAHADHERSFFFPQRQARRARK